MNYLNADYSSLQSDNKPNTFINKAPFMNLTMDYNQSEGDMARIVAEQYANGGLEDIKSPLTKEAAELVIGAIKKGLETGVHDFCKNMGKKTIDKSNISDFMKDYKTANKVIYELKQLSGMTEGVDFVRDACETYRTAKKRKD